MSLSLLLSTGQGYVKTQTLRKERVLLEPSRREEAIVMGRRSFQTVSQTNITHVFSCQSQMSFH
jgi:hypothetical protein